MFNAGLHGILVELDKSEYWALKVTARFLQYIYREVCTYSRL